MGLQQPYGVIHPAALEFAKFLFFLLVLLFLSAFIPPIHDSRSIHIFIHSFNASSSIPCPTRQFLSMQFSPSNQSIHYSIHPWTHRYHTDTDFNLLIFAGIGQGALSFGGMQELLILVVFSHDGMSSKEPVPDISQSR